MKLKYWQNSNCLNISLNTYRWKWGAQTFVNRWTISWFFPCFCSMLIWPLKSVFNMKRRWSLPSVTTILLMYLLRTLCTFLLMYVPCISFHAALLQFLAHVDRGRKNKQTTLLRSGSTRVTSRSKLVTWVLWVCLIDWLFQALRVRITASEFCGGFFFFFF